jgi:hypothetical protein
MMSRPAEDHAPRAPGGAARRIWPLHPFLFAAASVLDLMASNLGQTSFPDVAPALAGTFAFALAIYLGVGALRGRLDAATAVIASIWVAGCLFYNELFGGLNFLVDGGYPQVRSLAFTLPLLALLTVLAWRTRRSLIVVHTLLNGIALVVFATPAWEAAAWEWRDGAARQVYDADRAAAGMPQIAAARPDGERPPDIYHFVFDRRTSDAVLARYFGIEGEISDVLEDRGFYVARESHSNYLKTGHSLASTFYLDYLDFLGADPRVAGDNWHPIFEMLEDHRAARFLRAEGYDFLQFGSWWVGTHENPAADENHPRGFTEFNLQYLKRTMLRAIFHALPDTPFTMRLDWDYAQCQRVARQVEDIKAIGARQRPTYVFAHFLLPHDPFVFASDGRCLTLKESEKRGFAQGYVDHVAYANRIIEDLVATLQTADRPPIILISADEGPFPDRDWSVDWQDAPPDELRIKTGILNAFYFPGRDYHLLSQDITPVNTYRVLFNTYFDAGLPLLPDRIYTFPNDFKLFDFHDATDYILAADQARAPLAGSRASP